MILAGKEKAPNTPTGTLIVCPLAVLSVWKEQIRAHVKHGVLRTIVYHGARRGEQAELMSKADIVLTSYTTLVADFKYVLGRYTNAAHLVSDVANGFDDDTPPLQAVRADSIVSASPLAKLVWRRVVLDEAHCIRNRRSLVSQAVMLLRSQIKWCITATPIYSKVDDVFPLVRFLGIEPFCELEWWSRLISQPVRECFTVGFEHLTSILATFCLRRTKDQKVGPDRRPLLLLPPCHIHVCRTEMALEDRHYYSILYKIAQRSLSLLMASSSQQALFDESIHPTRESHEHWREARTLGSDPKVKTANVLLCLLRMRQASCHTGLIPLEVLKDLESGGLGLLSGKPTEEVLERLLAALEATLGDTCAICMGPMGNAEGRVVTVCNHVFCGVCLKQSMDAQRGDGLVTSCPLCRHHLEGGDVYPEDVVMAIEHAPDSATMTTRSAKVETLISILKKLIIGEDLQTVLISIEKGVEKRLQEEAVAHHSAGNTDGHGNAALSLSVFQKSTLPGDTVQPAVGEYSDGWSRELKSEWQIGGDSDNSEYCPIETSTEKTKYDWCGGHWSREAERAALLELERALTQPTATATALGSTFRSDDSVPRVTASSAFPLSTIHSSHWASEDTRSLHPFASSVTAARESLASRSAISTQKSHYERSNDAGLISTHQGTHEFPPSHPVTLSRMKSKSVVFSQWMALLNIVQARLEQEGIAFVRFESNMSAVRREAVVRRFQNDPSVHVMLLPLHAVGIGITLTAAINCFILDPPYNPGAQDQAVGCIHRMGQLSPVHVVIMVSVNTLEERVLALQQQKRAVSGDAPGTTAGTRNSQKIHLEDLCFLLRA